MQKFLDFLQEDVKFDVWIIKWFLENKIDIDDDYTVKEEEKEIKIKLDKDDCKMIEKQIKNVKNPKGQFIFDKYIKEKDNCVIIFKKKMKED